MILPLVAILMFSACALQQATSITPPPLQHSEPRVQVADVDVLSLSPEMEAFLGRYVLKYKNKETRLYLLMQAVTSTGVLGFDYDEELTLTASEAFERRAGNCIGFANMMVALARRSGLKASYQEVFRRPDWSSREDTVLLIKHINVMVESPDYIYVVDVSGVKINPNVRRRTIGDSYAKALYLNNIGAEALLDNKLPTAHAFLSSAIGTEPRITDAWVNLGVVLGRNSQLDDAEQAFLRALEIDASEYSAMNNLYEVYLAQKDLESAQALKTRVEKHRRNNPYYLLKLSDEALEQARYEESLRLLQRAIKKQQNDHLLHFALAKTQYLSGQVAAAEGSLVRARELAPENMLTYYGRPIGELVSKE